MVERDAAAGGWLRSPLAIGILLVIFLIALSVPGVERRAQRFQREHVIEQLALIAAAKEKLALDEGLLDGTTVTMEQLLAIEEILPSHPSIPPDVPFSINPIGTLPTAEFRGETLTPLTDYSDRLPGQER